MLKISISYPLVRIYLFLLSCARAFALGLGMASGFNYYFDSFSFSSYIAIYAVLFLFHWIVVMFYQAINKWVVILALIFNSAFAMLCRFFITKDYISLSVQESIWFGSWITVFIDLIFISVIIYNIYSNKKIKGNII